MDKKRLLLSFIAGAGVILVMNGAFFPRSLAEMASAPYSHVRSRPLMACHLLAHLATAFLLAYLYPSMRGNGPRAWKGFRFGALIGAIISIPNALHVYGMVDMAALGAVVPVFWTLIVLGLSGAAIALVFEAGAATDSRA